MQKRHDTLEEIMVEVVQATDAKGRRIRLYTGPLTAEGVREATYLFMQNFDPGAMFISGLEPGDEKETHLAEAMAWDNLALLARATAAAIREGK